MIASRLCVLVSAVLAAGCNSTPTSPTPPPIAAQPSTPTQPTPPATRAIVGTVRAVNGGQLISGATIDANGQRLTTNSQGQFTLTIDATTASYPITISAPTIETMRATVSAGVTNPMLDVIAHGNGFDAAFYGRFVFDTANGVTILRRQSQAPHIYLRTVDNAGAAIDAATLDTTAAAIINVAGLFTGGRFGIAGLERGTDTRRGQAGWITVEWAPNEDPNRCGTASPGSGQWILLYYKNRMCGCGNSAIRPTTVKHEIGHAMGFYHTYDAADLMSGVPESQCDRNPSTREIAHAAIAYSRPINTAMPDTWPSSAVIGVTSTRTLTGLLSRP